MVDRGERLNVEQESYREIVAQCNVQRSRAARVSSWMVGPEQSHSDGVERWSGWTLGPEARATDRPIDGIDMRLWPASGTWTLDNNGDCPSDRLRNWAPQPSTETRSGQRRLGRMTTYALTLIRLSRQLNYAVHCRSVPAVFNRPGPNTTTISRRQRTYLNTRPIGNRTAVIVSNRSRPIFPPACYNGRFRNPSG